MAPGEIADKISRVATAFGESAGSIAIVIALAAVIGECMMASGAADRIVQFFLAMLGEKRASWALMASGWVLAVPVFFDTVFYLLVPLARSLFKRTRKNYLLYILAIAAGGAITHTLVPPTPGPLVMASTLGIDLGKMIFVGSLVAIPAAIVALMCARVMDRVLNVPFRELETDQLPDDVAAAHPDAEVKLPPLWLASLPVLLPVVLIGANTALSTIADGERPARLEPADITDWSVFAAAAADPEADAHLAARRVLEQVDEAARTALQSPQTPSADEQVHIVAEFNRLLAAPNAGGLYNDAAFESVVLPAWKIARDRAAASNGDELRRLDSATQLNRFLRMDRGSLKLHERERLNRLALETAFPSIERHVWNTQARKASDVASLLGNANLALLFSAAVAMYLLIRQRGLSLQQLSSTVEDALAGAGVIILITAGGGAFGAMLKICGIREFIEAQFSAANASGLMFLFLGYAIAVVMKIAVGSSTVAMITVSSMLAAMISGGGGLGFDPVYLATAIGAGSLMGSWMNDSGFWIFTKMGGLTEAESLKSWTVLLAILSLTSLAMSVLLAIVMPMT
jgi:gluconate:H+ symporter, GntP family